ncbi:MAG: hypothetical protein AAB731_00570 [Patescibacteria group bacterium]
MRSVLAALVFVLMFSARDMAGAEKRLLPGLYKISGDCPVLTLKSWYCREGQEFKLRFESGACHDRPRPDAVWYDGKNFYFAWLMDHKSEDRPKDEAKNLVTSIYWIRNNSCPNLFLQNVCNNNKESFTTAGKCHRDANFFYWNGEKYRFGWVRLKLGRLHKN